MNKVLLTDENIEVLQSLITAEVSYCNRDDVDEAEKTKIAQLDHVSQALSNAREADEKLDTWTLTVTMTIFAGDMDKESVIAEAERQLPNLLDGTDFMSVAVIDAERDEIK